MEAEAIMKIFTDYGFINVIIMLITTVLVNFIKIPIKRRGDRIIEFARGLGIETDKDVINTCITYLPFVITFILLTIKELVVARHDLAQYDYAATLVNTLVYGGMSMGIYELISTNLKKLRFRKDYKGIVEEYAIVRKFNSGDLPKLSDDGNQQANDQKDNKDYEEEKNEKL